MKNVIRIKSVGPGSTIVGKYLAFVLISLEEQMDDIYGEEQQNADRLEVDESVLPNIVTQLIFRISHDMEIALVD